MPVAQRVVPQLPPGFRWIAVRPGSAPPPRRRSRPLGPTPRYAVIPRWGLVDHVGVATQQQAETPARAPSGGTVRATLIVTMAVLALAALVHVLRYVLLLVNRTILLPPLVANTVLLLGVLASLAAIVAVIVCALVLVRWLIARRAAAFAHRGRIEHRPRWALRAGCLIPVLNLAWAPVYVIELAVTEDHYTRLRKPILVWWILWLLSTAVSIFATATSFTSDAQGIADNTVTMIVAYLIALAAALALMRVYGEFERKPVERPAHRWVVVAEDGQAPDSAPAVEPEAQEPAA
jgi:hypothetical protein